MIQTSESAQELSIKSLYYSAADSSGIIIHGGTTENSASGFFLEKI